MITYRLIEVVAAIIIIYAASVYRIVISGEKNGWYYHKNDTPLPKRMVKKDVNIHKLESPAGYLINVIAFTFMLIVQRLIFQSYYWVDVSVQIIISTLFMASVFWTPSLWYQRGITAGTRADHELDSSNKSESTIIFKGWRKRLFSNESRKIAQWLGFSCFVTSVALAMWFNLLDKV